MTSDTRTITYRTRTGERGTVNGRWGERYVDGWRAFHVDGIKSPRAFFPDEVLTDDTPGLAADEGEELTAEERTMVALGLRELSAWVDTTERRIQYQALAARIERAGYVRIGGGR